MLRLTCQALACAVVLAPSLRAEILTVGPDDSAYDFTSIQAAIDAAVSGDTVQIAPGIYDGFSMTSKSVNVIGSGSDQTVLRAVPAEGSGGQQEWWPTASVWNVIDEPVAIGGFRIAPLEPGLHLGSYGLSLDRTGVTVYAFDIEVVIDRPLLTRKHQFRAPFLQNLVFDAVYSNCRTKIVPGWEPWAIENPGDFKGVAGFHAYDGRAWLSDCKFEGCPGPQCGTDEPDSLFGDPSMAAGAGLIQEFGWLTLANCELVGSDGAPGSEGCPETMGAPGLWRKSFATPDLEIHGGPNSLILGGSASANPGAAIRIDGSGDVSWGAGVQLTPGTDSVGIPGLELETIGAGQGVGLLDRRPSLGLSDPMPSLGGFTQLRLYGDRFAVCFPRWSAGGTDSFFLPNILGDGFLDLNTIGDLPPVVLDANGVGALSISVPSDPALLDHWYLLQMVEYDGDLEFAPPVVVGVAP